MKRILVLCLLVSAALLTGCAVLEEPEMNAVRRSGVEPYLVDKMEHGDPLNPGDIIALSRQRIGDDILVRYIARTGVRFTLSKQTADRMRRSGVSSRVVRVVAMESERYAADYAVSRAIIQTDLLYPGPYYGGYFW